jgi:HAD superfamily hydrolase (TIGR01509 family)
VRNGEAPAGVVFDVDGLLLDTEESWTEAERALFARYRRRFGPDEKRLLLGTSFENGGRLLERLLGQPGRALELSAELLDLVGERILEGAQALPGARDLVAALSGRTPLAVASNSPESFVRGALRTARLDGAFPVVVTADQVAEAKPAPDVYLEACRRLGARPAACVALEDSPTGVASARAAGLFVVGVPSLPGVALEADLVARSLAEPSLWRALGVAS